MRLWHEALLPYLPRQQLLGQHRECCALRGRGWGRRHSVVNYVFTHPKEWLWAYHMRVMKESIPGARVTECLRLEELAGKIGFFVTAGSDFHGEKIRADRKLGYTCGGKKIDDKIWEKIKNILL